MDGQRRSSYPPLVGDEGDSGKLVTVKAFGAELGVGAGLPKALAMLFPGWAAKRVAKAAFAGSIIEKVRDGQALDDADVLYATEVFGEAEAKFIRRRQIEARALVAFQEREALQLPAPAKGSPVDDAPKTTPEDWVNKYWEDAGLVTDEMLQELYARVLASEARSPGTCSLRTLRVLRYMDRELAEDFAKVAPLVARGEGWLPNALELLPRFGVSYSVITNCVEAGLLLPPNSNIITRAAQGQQFIRVGRLVIGMALSADATIAIIPLTAAGSELYSIAQFEVRSDYVIELGRWLKLHCSATVVRWAEMPSPDFQGGAELLSWQTIEG
jgi:hypothetical protein